MPAPVSSEGAPMPEMEWVQGPDAGRTTAGGGVAVAAAEGQQPLLVTADPGGQLRAAPEPPVGVIGPEECGDPRVRRRPRWGPKRRSSKSKAGRR